MSAASANLSGALTAANATVSGLITTNNATVTGTLTVDGNVITGQQQIPTEIGYGPQQNPVNGVNYLSNQPTNYTTTDIYGNVTVPGSLVINSNPPYTSQSSNVTGVTAVTHVGGSLSNQLVLGVYDSSQNVKSGYVQYNNGTNSQGANSFPGVNIGVTGGTAQVSIDATGNLIVPSNVLCNNLVVGGQNLSNSFGTGINIIAAGKAQFTSIASNGQSTYLTLTVTHNLNLNSAQLLNASIQCTANSYNNWHVLCNVTNSTANSFNVVVIHMYIGATANDIQANSMSSSGYGSYIDWTLMVLNYCNGNFA